MQCPSNTEPKEDLKAFGINDFIDPLKLPSGSVPFSLNLLADGDTWTRRQGRSFSLLSTGRALALAWLPWDDGRSNDIAQIGETLYDLA